MVIFQKTDGITPSFPLDIRRLPTFIHHVDMLLRRPSSATEMEPSDAVITGSTSSSPKVKKKQLVEEVRRFLRETEVFYLQYEDDAQARIIFKQIIRMRAFLHHLKTKSSSSKTKCNIKSHDQWSSKPRMGKPGPRPQLDRQEEEEEEEEKEEVWSTVPSSSPSILKDVPPPSRKKTTRPLYSWEHPPAEESKMLEYLQRTLGCWTNTIDPESFTRLETPGHYSVIDTRLEENETDEKDKDKEEEGGSKPVVLLEIQVILTLDEHARLKHHERTKRAEIRHVEQQKLGKRSSSNVLRSRPKHASEY